MRWLMSVTNKLIVELFAFVDMGNFCIRFVDATSFFDSGIQFAPDCNCLQLLPFFVVLFSLVELPVIIWPVQVVQFKVWDIFRTTVVQERNASVLVYIYIIQGFT
eukprot:TRINITY_DN10367_c0_g2_i8.p10 TRINITY_DN10367_c0_g2~~TRINITY_DN10367_c0_g2_i8.p10  ORF type:complete len:105 (-),score=4.49 TRINITY_DN10367_c0_g2_i8:759-1073(-)